MNRATISTNELLVPHTVKVSAGTLHWKVGRAESSFVRFERAALIAFSRLGNAEPSQIRDYAAKYGVLGLRPVEDGWLIPDERCVFLEDKAFAYKPTNEGSEPLKLWRNLAKRVRAILRINAALKGRDRKPLASKGNDKDWEELDVDVEDEITSPQGARFNLMEEMNTWLRVTNVGLRLGIVQWSRTRSNWKMEIDYDGLLGALAYHTLAVIVGEDTLYVCDGCGHPYLRYARAPRPGQENFCPDCPNVARRRALARLREKQKRGRQK
jgi:hypothetical protein